MTNTSPATTDLRLIATTWTDLHDALGAPNIVGGFGAGLRGYLTTLEQLDAEEQEAAGYRATALRALERDPAQIGERPTPIRLHVYDTMRAVEAALVELADQTAADVQRSPMSGPPRNWPANDRARREHLARADALDLRRWKYTGGRRRTAVYAALWLLGRVEQRPGPFIPLAEEQHHRIIRVAAGAAERIERCLDTGAETATLADPCPCGGTIQVHGGAGASPLAHCIRCGRLWTEQGSNAA